MTKTCVGQNVMTKKHSLKKENMNILCTTENKNSV